MMKGILLDVSLRNGQDFFNNRTLSRQYGLVIEGLKHPWEGFEGCFLQSA